MAVPSWFQQFDQWAAQKTQQFAQWVDEKANAIFSPESNPIIAWLDGITKAAREQDPGPNMFTAAGDKIKGMFSDKSPGLQLSPDAPVSAKAPGVAADRAPVRELLPPQEFAKVEAIKEIPSLNFAFDGSYSRNDLSTLSASNGMNYGVFRQQQAQGIGVVG